jgi:hypothetical protein
MRTIYLDFPKFQTHSHTDLKLVDITVGDLAHHLQSITEFNNTDGIWSLIGELRRGYANDRKRLQLALFRKLIGLELAAAAFGAY